MSKGPISIGAILLVAGIADHAYAAPKAALCRTDFGEFGQALDPSLAKDCSTYNTLEHAVGWLIGGGIALLVIGILWLVVAAGIIGTEMNRDRKNKGRAKGQPARHGTPRGAGPAAPTGFGTSAPFATPTPAGPAGPAATGPTAAPAPYPSSAPGGYPTSAPAAYPSSAPGGYQEPAQYPSSAPGGYQAPAPAAYPTPTSAPYGTYSQPWDANDRA